MSTRVDQTADTNCAELTRLVKLYEFPDFVKAASFDRLMKDDPSMSVSLFADPRTKQFPCNSAPATWLSYAYFTEKKAEFHPKDAAQIERRLDHYVGYWKIKAAVDKMKARYKELHKTAESQLPDSSFAWVWTGDNGTKERRLRLTNATEVKVAAEWLQTHQEKLPYMDRNKIATRILEKAANFGAAIGPYKEFLEKQAGQGVCSPEEVVNMIGSRLRHTNNPVVREHIIKLAEAVRTEPRTSLHPSNLVKLAHTIDMLDRGLQITDKYNSLLPRPEDVIFKATFSKAAGDMEKVVAMTSGRVYEKTAFKKLNLSDVEGLFGTEFAERVRTGLDVDPEKMAEEAAALPRPDAEMLDALLSENGISPMMRKAASARQGLSQEEMAAWAQAYQTVR